MLRILQTFDGHSINDGSDYQAVILNPYSLPPAQPVFVAQANADSEDAGVFTVDVHTIAISIRIRNYANRQALIAQLQGWFKRGNAGDLVAEFLDDGLDYYRPCRVVNLVQDPDHPLYFIATLNTGWTTWRAVTPETYEWNLTGTGGNHTVALSGDDETPLSVTFSLSAQPANGYTFQRFYQLINAPQTVPALGWGPWCITLDTAALISDSSKSNQINQGGGINNSTLSIPVDTPVGGGLPTGGGLCYVDSEQIRYTSISAGTMTVAAGGRGYGGTTPATHADNAVLKISHIQANCNDVRVFLDGKETNRWIGNPNNASTKIWFNLNTGAGYNLALKTAIASSGSISWIEFALTPDVLNALTAMPDEGILVHGTEWIKYKSKDLPNYRLAVTAREVLGSAMQAHSAADVFSFMEHVITVCYGNITAANPSSIDTRYDDTKPLFDVASSTNASWVYNSTSGFHDFNRIGRTGGFTPSILSRLGNATTYPKTHIAYKGAGANVLGAIILNFLKSGYFIIEQAALAWTFYRACGIDTTTFAGEKYRSTSILPQWPATAALQSSEDGKTYVNIWNEAAPSSEDTWQALATHSGDDTDDDRWIRFLFSGSLSPGDIYAAMEIQSGTINFVSANLPTGTLLSQQTNGQLELTLSNGANSDALALIFPMLLGLPLALDGDARTVLYDNTNAHDAMTLNDKSRSIWIRLQPGNNQLTIASVDVGTLQADLSWHRRRF